MKYARVRNNKVVKIDSVEFPDSMPIKKVWEIPTDYPLDFYHTGKIYYRVNTVTVSEDRDYTLKTIDEVKELILQQQKEKRQKMQLGSFMVGEMEIYLKDREDSLIISSLNETETRYKVGQGQWVTLTPNDIIALKAAHHAHVQAAYDWEMTENEKVLAMNTLDELAEYFKNG